MFPKPLTSVRRRTRREQHLDLVKHERDEKHRARRRDSFRCRFPLCGCRALGLPLEVAHLVHKGVGGNPLGDRSTVDNLITLCAHRHQAGRISWHHGTLRIRPLTVLGTNGPVAWFIDHTVLDSALSTGKTKWIEVARETGIQQLEPLTTQQQAILLLLAKMEV